MQNTGRLLLLDTFCKAGGTSMGYHRAGFEVISVDSIHYQFHRSIHEVGRPQLLNEILDLMKIINNG